MYLSASDAAERLGVSRTTLYAYVSRGLVRSRPKPGTRQRQYAAADIETLVQRKQARRDPGRTASQALGVRGLPVLDSALTSIEAGVLCYRGYDVARLCTESTPERVAELLWGGPIGEPTPVRIPAATSASVRALPLVQAMHAWLAGAGAADGAAYNLSPDGVRRCGTAIVRGLAGVAAGTPSDGRGDGRSDGRSVGQMLADGWGVPGRAALKKIQAALICCADHELNVSAFTGRCVASARGTPYMVVTAALAALHGHRHGGETERTAAMLEEPGPALEVIAGRLRRGDRVPGFGHPLYPEGDPRGKILLSLAGRGRSAARARSFVDAAQQLLGLAPTLDLGLVALGRALGLPPHAPLSLFAVGRAVGWVAHAIEQYAVEPMIRPRARYVGPAPR